MNEMVRKMAYIGFSYIIALIFVSFLNCSYKFNFLLAVGLIIIGTLYLLTFTNKKATIGVCILSAAIGVGVFGMYQLNVYEPIVAYNNQIVTINGRITQIEMAGSDMASFIIKGKINNDITANITMYTLGYDCDYSDYISLSGKVEVLKDSFVFPAESYYRSQDVYLQIKNPKDVAITKNTNFSLTKTMMQYQSHLTNTVMREFPNEIGHMLSTMLYGSKSLLNDNAKTALYRTGIGHIMSVSGMHLAIVALVIMSILNFLRLNVTVKFIITEIILIVFTLIIGLSPSILRSLLMITIVNFNIFFGRRADSLNSLGIAAIILTLFTPYIAINSSFLLSFSGVFGFAVIAPAFTKTINFSKNILGKLYKDLVSLSCVAITALPVSIMFFDEASILSPITNMFLTPICTIAIFCGLIIALTGGIGFIAYPLLLVAGGCCRIILVMSRFVANLNFSHISLGYNFLTLGVIITMISVVACYLIFKNKRLVVLTIVCCTASILITSTVYKTLNSNTLQIAVVGTNRASNIIMHKGKNAVIIDLKGGGNLPYTTKYLNRLGISNIRMLLLSENGYSSSISNYISNLEFFQLDKLIMSENLSPQHDTTKLQTESINYNNTLIHADDYSIEFTADNTISILFHNSKFVIKDGKLNFNIINSNSAKYDYNYVIFCKPNIEPVIRRLTSGSRQ